MFVIVIWNDVAVGLPMVVVAGLIALVDRRRRPSPDPGPATITPDPAAREATRP
jgi:hypothetical protein